MAESLPPIVVGVDGSTSCARAVDWAAAAAARRHLPLELLHAKVEAWSPGAGDPTAPQPLPPPGGSGEDVPACLADARHQVREGWPDVEVSTRIVPLGAPYALVTASADATMVVVGARGLSIAGRILLGSVSHHVAAHARCPAVVVKRSSGDPTLPVVVGIDETATSQDTLEVAVEEAVRRKVPLVAVHAWAELAVTGYGVWAPPPDVVSDLREYAERLVSTALEGWARRHLELEIHERAVRGHPVDVLLEEADHAQLLVVGAHGRGAFPGMLIGSVASGVVQHADCPVVVVPPRTGRPAP